MTFQPVGEHYSVLTNHLVIDPLLPYLRHQNWLTPQEHDMLTAIPSTQKMELIQTFLCQKNGRVVCDEVFIKCIIWSGQFDLAKLLGCNEHYIQQVNLWHPFPAPRSTRPMDNSHVPGPYPPPPGVNNVSPVRSWLPGEVGTAVEVRRRRVPSSEVVHPTFIVYSKDDDPHNHVCDLSDFLNHCGVDCDIDQYHTNENILDWGGWSEGVIKDRAARNGYVLLVCSPKLYQQLSNVSSSVRIEMKAGHISNMTLNALIKDEKITHHIIPVFLEQHRKEFILTCLGGRLCYSINITKIIELSSHGRGIDDILNAPGLEWFRSLVLRLRGEPDAVKPPLPMVPPPMSIPIPPPCGSPEQSPRVSPLPSTHSPKSSAKKQPDQQSSPNKIHRTEVEGEVADGFLQKVAENIGRDWSRLGLRLGIEFRTLEQIRSSVPYDLRQQAYLMLVQWKETHKTVATMVELQDKLDELKLGRIGRLSRT